ncbi:Lsr2 family protein [Microbacterium sp. NPDC008134]|uniref:histone-like nucleoid-structuring protein Lsr2 n=1 Tax=Microbacterium sp. NPDC008134 TaxID=3364183 RepID=UPI0036E87025
MASNEVTELVDDLDGSEAHHRITFAYRERRYEIDLSTDNAETFFNLLLPYIEAGRPARPETESTPPPHIEHIRAWARENGFAVSDRGRIAHHIRRAFAESQRESSTGTR